MDFNFSYWEKQSFFQYDIIIIGSGIVGLNAAIHLKRKNSNLRIAILERGFLPSGASTKNAGFACFGSISELVEQEKVGGIDTLYNLVEKRWKGLLKLRNILGDAAIDFQNNGGYELFKENENEIAENCINKINYFNQLLKPIFKEEKVFELDNKSIAKFGFKQTKNLIANRFEAQIDTGKMMSALIQKAMSLGIIILNNCEATEFKSEENKVHIFSRQGNFSCNKALLATNAFSKQFLPDEDIVPGRGQVLITKPILNLKANGTFHYDKGYYYFRNINNRILVGGGRNLDFEKEKTTEFGFTNLVQDKLEQLLKEVILPNTKFEIDQRWSGIMAFGSQIEPIIKEVNPNVFCAIRGSGMGVAIGSDTGEKAAELILSR